MGSTDIGRRPMVIAVCGVKNSGKTTLLVRLVERLTERGIKIAVIKHDGHDFTCDIEGTDSYRLHQAGAYGTAVYSDHRVFVHKEGTGEREDALIGQFPEADLILLEGMKDSIYPKIEVVRRGISDEPVSNPAGRFLIATDWEPEKFEEPAVNLNNIELILEKMLERCQKEEGGQENGRE